MDQNTAKGVGIGTAIGGVIATLGTLLVKGYVDSKKADKDDKDDYDIMKMVSAESYAIGFTHGKDVAGGYEDPEPEDLSPDEDRVFQTIRFYEQTSQQKHAL